MSEYVVLRNIRDDGEEWRVIGTASATNDRQAIRIATAELAGREDSAGKFVAIPTRSWRPRTQRVETVQKVLWS